MSPVPQRMVTLTPETRRCLASSDLRLLWSGTTMPIPYQLGSLPLSSLTSFYKWNPRSWTDGTDLLLQLLGKLMQEDSQFKATVGNFCKVCLKIKCKKRAGDVAQWWSTSLAWLRSWVQSLVQQNSQNKIRPPSGVHRLALGREITLPRPQHFCESWYRVYLSSLAGHESLLVSKRLWNQSRRRAVSFLLL